MSEQLPDTALSGTGSTTGTTTTGVYRALENGKSDSAGGKVLPRAAIETPELEQLASALNTISRTHDRDLHFQVDLDDGTTVLQVIDRETGDVIRRIPHERAAQVLDSIGIAQIRLIDALI
jgi:flagellar protein FlaG